MWESPYPLTTILIVSNFNMLWTALYVLAIRRGFLDKTYGLPIASVFLNIGWDLVNFAFVPGLAAPQRFLSLFFFLIQLVIVYQVFRFWRREASDIPSWQFYSGIALTAAFSFALMLGTTLEFQEAPPWRSGYVNTFVSSALFIGMFYQRYDDLRGQSVYIGLAKLLGSGPLALALYLSPWPGFEGSILLPILYLGIFLLDLYYVILMVVRSRELGINPWKRF